MTIAEVTQPASDTAKNLSPVTNRKAKRITNKDLIYSAVQYGIYGNGYLRSPTGMITEGYRYQLRQLYLKYLIVSLQLPGNTLEKIQGNALEIWKSVLELGDYSPEENDLITKKLSSKISEWSRKYHSGLFYSFQSRENISSVLTQKLSDCLRNLSGPLSDPIKLRSCNGSDLITRQEPVSETDLADLIQAMKLTVNFYIRGLHKIQTLPYYGIYKEALNDFRAAIFDRLDAGYEAKQIAQILEFAGVNYDIVYEKLYYHALRYSSNTHTQ